MMLKKFFFIFYTNKYKYKIFALVNRSFKKSTLKGTIKKEKHDIIISKKKKKLSCPRNK